MSKSVVSTFYLEGQFIGLSGKSSEKPKYLLIATEQGEREIKLSKALRHSLPTLIVGERVAVSGQQKLKFKEGKLKLKANEIIPTASAARRSVESLPQSGESPLATSQPTVVPPKKAKDCILICQKSSCCKRGARRVYQTAIEALQAQGLEQQITVKGTGCMNQCKKGPCIVFKSDKARYVGVDPEQIPTLMQKHCAFATGGEDKAEATRANLAVSEH